MSPIVSIPLDEPLPLSADDRIQWLTIERCPACDSPPDKHDRLIDDTYRFGDERIAFPGEGVHIAHCGTCDLHFKNVVPSPTSLAQVMERQAGKKWMEPYDFRKEIEELLRITNGNAVDLLDVGSGNGGLLAAWSHYSHGRRSALDVVQHPGCADHVDGEFIVGLLDGERLNWSRKPYDVVTVFDVLEHLYSPQKAFAHLSDLTVEHGLVVVETGNAESAWPARDGVHRWWYARLFEHHIFWSRRALELIAERFGFQPLIWREVRHKARASAAFTSKAVDLAQVGVYRLAPNLYPKIAPLIGKYWTQPWSPFTSDHFRVVLRKQ